MSDFRVTGPEMPDHVLMQMYAALLPPQAVLDDLAAVVRSVRGSDVELDAVPADRVHLPLGVFGNVGLADRLALQATLREEAACWAPLELRFSGGSALVAPGDDAVWAHLEGDLVQLTAMGTVIPRVVHRLGFLIDRRTFATRVRVGRINPATSVEFLERMLLRLDGYCGPAWTAHHVSLLRRRTGSDELDPEFDVLHELALTGDPRSTGATGGRHRSPGAPLDTADQPVGGR
jgi:RNA 2',3'-cyclic 3'-phosphodiesterase